MAITSLKPRVILIAALVAVTTSLHYSADLGARHLHVFHLGLYFLPVIVAGFWFGLLGALATSSTITVLSLPFVLMCWEGFSADDLNNIKILVLYNTIAVVLGILRDRERAEQKRLREAESLAAMGKALSGVAHDMKTPLVAIGGFTRLVQKYIDEDTPHRDKLDIVLGEVQRLESLVKDMLDFSRPLELNLGNEDANRVIRECLSILSDIARDRNVKLQSELSEDLPPVCMDAMRMKQAVINLVMNAIQATPAGETVTVRTCYRGGELIIDVTDRGCGIPVGKRAEVFSQFFTTKRDGTGLGLPITKKIVDAHNGYLKILDNPERGLTFRVATPGA